MTPTEELKKAFEEKFRLNNHLGEDADGNIVEQENILLWITEREALAERREKERIIDIIKDMPDRSFDSDRSFLIDKYELFSLLIPDNKHKI